MNMLVCLSGLVSCLWWNGVLLMDSFCLPTGKYQKEEKIEVHVQRKKKEDETLALADVEQFLRAPYLNAAIDAAVACLNDETCRPSTLFDFTNLRDVLCTLMLIKSLRRLMEFTEFRLSEYDGMKLEGESYVIRIARHKTAVKGQNLL